MFGRCPKKPADGAFGLPLLKLGAVEEVTEQHMERRSGAEIGSMRGHAGSVPLATEKPAVELADRLVGLFCRGHPAPSLFYSATRG
jgi:hypothetical protein